MPTQHEYTTAANDLRAKARSYRDTVAWSPPQPSTRFVGPGPIAEVVESRYDGVRRLLGIAAGELDAAAAECDRRAAVCAEYARERRSYWSTPESIREHLRPPVRPAGWVEI